MGDWDLSRIGMDIATLGANELVNHVAGEARQYNPYAVDPSVGQYGSTPGYYDQRLAQLEEERAQAQKQQGISYTQSQISRGFEQDAARSYQDVLSGKAPSLAEMQMRQATQSNTMGAMNMAASARGGGGMQLLAMQQAQRQQALGGQQAAMDTAMLRAKEQDAARAGLAGVGGQMRQGDMSQQQLEQQRQMGLLGAQQDMTAQQGQQKLGAAQVASGAYSAAQGNSAASQQAVDRNRSQMWGGAINAGGGIAAKGMGA